MKSNYFKWNLHVLFSVFQQGLLLQRNLRTSRQQKWKRWDDLNEVQEVSKCTDFVSKTSKPLHVCPTVYITLINSKSWLRVFKQDLTILDEKMYILFFELFKNYVLFYDCGRAIMTMMTNILLG